MNSLPTWKVQENLLQAQKNKDWETVRICAGILLERWRERK